MYRRRRRPSGKIPFSFDSFLDVVANVNGIIIRLILVAWVGARAYHGGMKFADEPTPDAPVEAVALPSPRREDDPLTPLLAEKRQALASFAVRQREVLAQTTQVARVVDADATARDVAQKRRDAASFLLASLPAPSPGPEPALPLGELETRAKALAEAIGRVEAEPPAVQGLRYRTPVSKAVTSDEVFFECRSGRVAYLDIPGFLKEIETSMPGREAALRDQYRVEDVTKPIGAFRVRYSVERRKTMGESFGGAGDAPRERVFFGYGLGRFEVEPIQPLRGENATRALEPTSEFRQIVDALDSQTVVTLWVYPDSFALFRSVRDYLHHRGLEVAARPLPPEEPIAGSPTGSRSRGQ